MDGCTWNTRPAWAEVGFAGIKADMARRAAETQGKREEITLYCPSRNWDPKHRMRAHLDARFPGTLVQIVRPADYPEGQPVPVHALPQFHWNPLDNFNVCGPMPEWLRGYWTTANQSPSWRGESTNHIFRQETRLRNIIMGYAAHAVRHMTTYEYRAPGRLNHGLAILHEEMSHYLVPPMLEDAAGLLGDFTAITEALSACQVQICAHENQSAHSRQEARNAAYLQAEEEAHLKRELDEARTQLRQVEAERDDAVGQWLDLHDARRELQAQLSAKAAELRVNEGVVKQLEADVKQLEIDLVEVRRLQKAATSGPIEMLPVPRVTHSQALATSISRMTLGVAQPPASTAPAHADCADAGRYY